MFAGVRRLPSRPVFCADAIIISNDPTLTLDSIRSILTRPSSPFLHPPSSQWGFWFTLANGIKEMKPHLFKHNCKICNKAGIMKCGKCDGHGVAWREAKPVADFDSMKVDVSRSGQLARGQAKNDAFTGYLPCEYCKQTGVQTCRSCKGVGWHYLPFVNQRKFEPHPIFEDFHWARCFGNTADRKDMERTMQKDIITDAMMENKARKEAEEDADYARKIAEKRARKEDKVKRAKEKKGGGGFAGLPFFGGRGKDKEPEKKDKKKDKKKKKKKKETA